MLVVDCDVENFGEYVESLQCDCGVVFFCVVWFVLGEFGDLGVDFGGEDFVDFVCVLFWFDVELLCDWQLCECGWFEGFFVDDLGFVELGDGDV